MQKKKTKAVNVRCDSKTKRYFVLMSDGSEISWEEYVAMGPDKANPKLSKLSTER